ncbi:hypothetical protein [Candidatus Spongiihabitans sp.]|uniref:hypothetical protein n=1 Tax=Candidatus Spongiihabitans sp. TaxID=3101308 RepID=UPI003C7AB880
MDEVVYRRLQAEAMMGQDGAAGHCQRLAPLGIVSGLRRWGFHWIIGSSPIMTGGSAAGK